MSQNQLCNWLKSTTSSTHSTDQPRHASAKLGVGWGGDTAILKVVFEVFKILSTCP